MRRNVNSYSVELLLSRCHGFAVLPACDSATLRPLAPATVAEARTGYCPPTEPIVRLQRQPAAPAPQLDVSKRYATARACSRLSLTLSGMPIYLPPMRRCLCPIFAVLLLAVTGCAESYVIRSYPDNVRMSVNEQYVGITPVVMRVPRSELRDSYRWTAEKEGYETQEGTMHPRVGVGRVFGYIFTAGILAVFKGPRYMPDLTVDMKPLPKTASGAAPAGGESIEDRLKQADSLHSRDIISDSEYEALRRSILLGNSPK